MDYALGASAIAPPSEIGKERIRQVLTVLDEIVAGAGADKVANCVYVDTESDMVICLGGQALVKLGVSKSRLREGTSATSIAIRELGWEFPESLVLGEAQNFQDAGSTWGSALEAATAVAARYGVTR